MVNFARFVLFAFVLLSISSCGPGTPGYIKQSVSTFDGSGQLSMEPAWLYDSPIKLALFKNSKMNDNEIILTAVVQGAHIFAKGKSLHFNVDGDVYSFESFDSLTEFETSSGYRQSGTAGIYIPPSNWSSKDYELTTEFIDLILNARRVAVKVNLQKTYAEGLFSKDFGNTTARNNFRKFMKLAQAL